MDKLTQVINFKQIDVIGDIHGCYDELTALLRKLGYTVDEVSGKILSVPEERKIIFLGDFVDRGPRPVSVLKLVMDAVEKGFALSVRGNHEEKLLNKLTKKSEAKDDLLNTINLINEQGEEFVRDVLNFIEDLPFIIFNPEEDLVIAHAGLKKELQDLFTEDIKFKKKMKAFVLYGETTGKFDERGFPVRVDWAANYTGSTTVVYGHIPLEFAQWKNRTIDIDTGCFQTGHLTALRLPEKLIIST